VPGRASSDVPDRPDPVGAKVVDAQNTEIALRRLADTDVDLMVTDIEPLSGADGLELTATVRKRYPVLPVVVLSGHTTFDHAVVAMRAGASEFLPKPVDPERLTTAATALLEQRRRRVAIEAVSVLAISAHPDDAEIGMGATLASGPRSSTCTPSRTRTRTIASCTGAGLVAS
jgi:DNA-binding NtrC family response regulator